MHESRVKGSKSLTIAGMRKTVGLSLIAISTVLVGWVALAPGAGAQPAPDQQCPGEPGAPAPPSPIIHSGDESGTFSQGGMTITWSGTTVTITGPGTVTFCVKGGQSPSTGVLTLPAGTYSTTELGLTGPNEQAQGVSHLVVYGTTTPTTTTTSSSTTTTTSTSSPPTTTTTTSSTSVAPTTVTPPDDDNTPPDDDTTQPGTSVAPTTVTPGGTAFTGPENVIPLGVIALTLMTAGSGVLWAGSRRGRREKDLDS